MRHVILILLVFLTGCSSSKKTEELESLPVWIKDRPAMSGYYVGIGSAPRVGTKQEYVARARENALQDMVSEISAQVSSSSVLQTIENEYGITETYSERVEIKSEDYLEGFEPVDYYESEDRYWAYFRIRRDVYRQNKLKRKREAVESALAKFTSGRDKSENNCPVEAIYMYLQGLEHLKRYLSEELPVDYRGRSVDLGEELLGALKDVVSNMQLTPPESQVEINGGSVLQQSLGFRLTFNGQPVPGVPVSLNYSGRFLKFDRQYTDQNGEVSIELGRITSDKKEENLIATIDCEAIAAKAVSDVFIRSILRNIPAQSASIQVNINSPVLDIHIEGGDSHSDYNKKIRALGQRKLRQYNLVSGEQGEDIDYTLRVSFSFNQGTSAGGLTSVYVVSIINLLDGNGEVVGEEIGGETKGVGRDAEEAREKAFDAFLQKLDRRYLDQILEEQF